MKLVALAGVEPGILRMKISDPKPLDDRAMMDNKKRKDVLFVSFGGRKEFLAHMAGKEGFEPTITM